MRQFNGRFILGDNNEAQAGAGTSGATATVLTANHNWIATAAAGSGVMLKEMPAGELMSVTNATGNTPLLVYPWSGANFNGVTADLPVSVPANSVTWFYIQSQTKISTSV